MKIVIFGSTGGTGRCLVEQALSAGHTVTAFARNPSNVLIHHERLCVLQGDVLDSAKVEIAIAGQDAVLSALGVGLAGGKRVLSNGTRNIITAMEKHGVRRLLVESSYGVGDSFQDASLLLRIIFQTVLRSTYEDKAREDEIIRASGLEWIVVRPAALTNGPRRGDYRVGEHLRFGLGTKISRADVADFMIRQLEESKWLRRFPALGY
jgi:putative NADH-flavin reductase